MKPNILAVDDRVETISKLALALEDEAQITVVGPGEITLAHLRSAHLVLLDYNLEEWDGSTRGDLATRPRNGLALAAVLRAHLGDQGLYAARATAFALRTAYLNQLSPEAGVTNREHILARHNNLEWVFKKDRDNHDRFLCLAKAITELRKVWTRSATKRREACEKLLKVPSTPWKLAAAEDIDACHPPIHDLAGKSHGLPLLRWMLHRVLPYPCFLWSRERLAVRLRITAEHLKTVLAGKGRLAKALKRCLYTGILAGFQEERWWTAGIEHELWELTDGRPRDPAVLAALTGSGGDDKREPELVMCLDEDHSWFAEPIPMSKAVRIQPDDWPPFAEQAWTSMELAREDATIGNLVIRADLERLKGSP
ncbi:MAG TPA: hypothetical protein VGM90_14070 [Kofleriaceae bacterium]